MFACAGHWHFTYHIHQIEHTFRTLTRNQTLIYALSKSHRTLEVNAIIISQFTDEEAEVRRGSVAELLVSELEFESR